MRVLQICHRVPFPPIDGGSIAMHQLTRGLIDEGISVKVLALSPLLLERSRRQIPEDYLQRTQFESVTIDNRINFVSALSNLFFSNKPYNIERYQSRAMDASLRRILSNDTFDVIQLEGIYLTPYIPLIRSYSSAVLFYRAHNIEHFIWERLAQTSTNPVRRAYLKLLASRLQRFEKEIIHQVDGLVAISEVDRQFFLKQGFKRPSIVIPAGMPELSFPEPPPAEETNSVFHLGSMDWRPNQEGVSWFVKKVWPLVTAKRPELVLYLAGRRMPAHFYLFENDHIKVVGEVHDAIEFILSKNIMVVPLLSGGGMRVKIIEGMAAAKTIISTKIGAEGIGCTHGLNILIADTPEEMANWIVLCADDKDYSKTIGNQAQIFATEEYNLKHIIKNLLDFYRRF